MGKSQIRTKRNMKKQENMTPQKVNHNTTKDLSDSERKVKAFHDKQN
jgi:hypothetical protein